MAKAPSFEQANRRAFALFAPPGAERATTRLANRAASGGTVWGLKPSMTASGAAATVTTLWQHDPPGWWILWEASVMEPTRRQQRRLEAIQRELAAMGPCLPGSLVVRTGRCGKNYCACQKDPPRLHGPFRSWTRKVAGKTVTRLLSEEQLEDYQALFDNHRRLKELVRELEQLSLEMVEDDGRRRRS